MQPPSPVLRVEHLTMRFGGLVAIDDLSFAAARGEITAIGGLKEKLLAALRGGIKTVLIPEENAKDLQEIPDNVKSGLEIIPVKWIDQVLAVALERMPVPLSDEEVALAAAAIAASAAAVTAQAGAIKH